jgi:hypothetical protein
VKAISEVSQQLSPVISTRNPTTKPIMVIMNKSNPLHLIDTKEISQQAHFGPTGTFNGFQSKEINDQPIDYNILKGKFIVLQHATLSQTLAWTIFV